MVDGPYRHAPPRVPELGIVAVWSGSQPISKAFRIPHDGLVLGHPLLGYTDDNRIGRNHARVEVAKGGDPHLRMLTITDLDSQNHTYVGGEQITTTVYI